MTCPAIGMARWPGPARAGSLTDGSGRFYRLEQRAYFTERADLDELDIEFRAQIQVVLTAGLRPGHLDWHCLVRHTDYEFLMSAQARQVIEDEGIVLLSHEPARRVWASQEGPR